MKPDQLQIKLNRPGKEHMDRNIRFLGHQIFKAYTLKHLDDGLTLIFNSLNFSVIKINQTTKTTQL